MLKFIDKYFWWCLLVIIVMVILMSLLLGNYSGMYCWFYKNAYLDNTNLVTISTVFIGIYFSLYGFLLSSDTNSLVSKLRLKEYKRLVSIVNRGFLSSFIIVIFSFFNENIYNWVGKIYILFLFCIFLRYLQLNAVCFLKKSTFLRKQTKRRKKDCMNFPPHILPRLRTP